LQPTDEEHIKGNPNKDVHMEEFDSFVLYHEMKKHTEVSKMEPIM
jgi:hypothetical protein